MYLFYVEESGEREYNPRSSDPFVTLALGIAEADWHKLNADINGIKQTHFGTRDVKVKSNYLRRPKERQTFYKGPYGVTDATLTSFTEALYACLDSAPVHLLAVVIDKQQMWQGDNAFLSATTPAYIALVEQIQLFLKLHGDSAYGLIIHDLIAESPSLTNTHQQEIVKLHEQMIFNRSTPYKPVPNLIEGCHFIPDDQINFLQMADFVAYNVLRQFRKYSSEWDANVSVTNWEKYEYFARILPKFFKSKGGELRDYGLVKQP